MAELKLCAGVVLEGDAAFIFDRKVKGLGVGLGGCGREEEEEVESTLLSLPHRKAIFSPHPFGHREPKVNPSGMVSV